MISPHGTSPQAVDSAVNPTPGLENSTTSLIGAVDTLAQTSESVNSVQGSEDSSVSGNAITSQEGRATHPTRSGVVRVMQVSGGSRAPLVWSSGLGGDPLESTPRISSVTAFANR